MKIVLFVVGLFFTPIILAQDPAEIEDPVDVYGGGDRPTLQYTNERNQSSLVRLDTGYEAAYDDNPLLSSSNARHDVVQSATGHALILHQGAVSTFSVEYWPLYQFYNYYSEYNRLQHAVTADLLLRLNTRWSIRARNDFRDQTGTFSRTEITSGTEGIGAPTGLNQTIYTPLTRERQEMARLDAIRQLSAHSSVDVFGAYDQRSFPQRTAELYGVLTRSAGGEFTWQVREHASLGLLGLLEQMNITGSPPPGTASRLQIGSVLPTAGWRPTPTLEFTGFAGTQWVRSKDMPGEPSTPTDFLWSAGGSVADHTERAAIVLSAEHTVNDGGGLMTYVVSTAFTAGWRRRIRESWELRIDAGVSRNQWYPATSTRTRITGATGSVLVSRPLGPRMNLQVDYEHNHQQASDASVSTGTFERNRMSAGITWTLKSLSYGR